MGITIIIVVGLVLATFIAGMFSYLEKTKPRIDPQLAEKLQQLEQRLAQLDERLTDREQHVQHLEGQVSFVSRLLEEKSPPK